MIELLVVIAIIAVLAAIAFPVFTSVQNRARSVQATSDMRSIKAAVASYYAEYGKYPITSAQELSGTGGSYQDSVFGNPNGAYYNSDLFNILRAQPDNHYGDNHDRNPNQTVYWGGPFAKNASKPRSGITTQDVTVNGETIHAGSLVDPWGNAYVIWFNVSKSGDLTGIISGIYKDYTPVTDQNRLTCGLPPLGVECASRGPDGGFGAKGNGVLKGSDDIVTWSHP